MLISSTGDLKVSPLRKQFLYLKSKFLKGWYIVLFIQGTILSILFLHSLKRRFFNFDITLANKYAGNIHPLQPGTETPFCYC
ncbi:hypothetical protein D3C85_1783090 [compost metagenome]